MKNENLLKLLKQGKFNSLDITITSNQFKDIEIARWFFKNLVENKNLLNKIITFGLDKNTIRLSKIYNVLVNIKQYDLNNLKTDNYENLKDLALYLEPDNKDFIYNIVDSIIKYDNMNNIIKHDDMETETEKEQLILDLCRYILDANICNERKEMLYKLFVSKTSLYKDMLTKYPLGILKLMANTKPLINLFPLINFELYNTIDNNFDKFNLFEKINLYSNIHQITYISVDEIKENMDLVLNEIGTTDVLVKLLSYNRIFEKDFDILNTIWDVCYDNQNLEALNYLVKNIRGGDKELLLNLKLNDSKFNNVLCNYLIQDYYQHRHSVNDGYSIMISNLLNLLDLEQFNNIINSYDMSFIWEYIINVYSSIKIDTIITLLVNISMLTSSILTIYGIGDISLEYILAMPIRVHEFILTKLYGRRWLFEEEWLMMLNNLKEKGYADNEIEFIKNRCIYVKHRYLYVKES